MRLAALSALLLAGALAHADQAVVIGINRYASDGPRTLRGPENDAADMVAFCREAGYTVSPSHLLIGKAATRAAILAALRDLEKVGKDERVIFYFAGHGAKSPKPALLPYDFNEIHDDSVLTVDDLYVAMRRVPSKANRTVILDSCFSGAMSRDLAEGLTARCYVRGLARGGEATPDLPDDSQAHLGQPTKPGEGDKICYLTAAKGNEAALEAEIDGVPHGLFTHALIPELRKSGTCGVTRADVQTSIAEAIAAKGSLLHQTPSVTDEFNGLVVLKGALGGKPPPPPPPPKAVWDLVTQERPDAKRLTLSIEPGRSDFLVGQTARLKVKAGEEGYLVVLWDQKKIEVVRPSKGANDAYEVAHVEPGESLISPRSGSFFTQAGGNRITALLFHSPGAAQKLVDSLTKGETPQALRLHGLADVDDGSKAYVSAGLTLAVADEIFGGLRIADAPALFAELSKGGFLADANPSVLKEIEEGGAPQANAYLACAVNSALAVLATKGEVIVDPTLPGLTPEQASKAKEAKAKIEGAKGDDVLRINARLLRDLFPKLIVEAAR